MKRGPQNLNIHVFRHSSNDRYLCSDQMIGKLQQWMFDMKLQGKTSLSKFSI